MSKQRPIYTLDLETDPFVHGRKPMPFCAGLSGGIWFEYTWGERCIEEMFDLLYDKEPGIVYIHNGGRFDIFYLMRYIVGKPMKIINGRITLSKMECRGGHHELRDSYSIIPVALKRIQDAEGKLEIDYKLMEKGVREKHRFEIVEYLKRDCAFLWRLAVEFIDMFGVQLTIGGTAMRQLRGMYQFERLDLDLDKEIRPKYYYGGRVECFESGIIDGDFKLYDVNSMYPYAMKAYKHPVSKPIYDGSKVTNKTQFITATGHNYGAFPSREGLGLRFDVEYGTFMVTRHEWDMAEHLGLFKADRILSCVEFEECISFDEFVDRFYDLRMKAQRAGDGVKKEFYKLVLNSSYGKFAQSSENYCESRITDATEDLTSLGWTCTNLAELGKAAKDCYLIWERPSFDDTMYNVATGCSITGAARSILMEAIHRSQRPIYCDTDSLICEHLPIEVSKKLGDWKLEAQCDRLAIAGKKLYALFKDGECIKQANKGVAITAQEIVSVCEGEEVVSRRNSPSFKLDGQCEFITRRIRMTA